MKLNALPSQSSNFINNQRGEGGERERGYGGESKEIERRESSMEEMDRERG